MGLSFSLKFDSRIKYALLIIWIVFTLALAGWLFYFSFEQISFLKSLGGEEAANAVRYHRMLMWESTVLFASLIGGAIVIGFYILRDHEQGRKIKNFFLTFSHELKTPLASLQLQAESLREDLGNSSHMALVDRLSMDASRLALQLENSLHLAEGDMGKLYLEDVNVNEAINNIAAGWPKLKIKFVGEGNVKADRRDLDSIIRNIISNAVVHGKATELSVSIDNKSKDYNEIIFTDNGGGFSGGVSSLGTLFGRTYSGSGNGIGLYLIKTLTERMGGKVMFPSTKPNFVISLKLPRA